LRKLKLARDRFCEDCLGEGVVELAVEVHHKVARAGGGALLVPLDELLSLCKRHHGLRRAAEARANTGKVSELRVYSVDKEFLVG
jgi:5-methylcytosine-specific restriction endonuclease McrA